jgi:hypothetical protein
MTEVAYGFRASLFFIGYLIFEVPSNSALHKVGARRSIARIMLTWGICHAVLAWTNSALMYPAVSFSGRRRLGSIPGSSIISHFGSRSALAFGCSAISRLAAVLGTWLARRLTVSS